jgi:D-alanine-D-alanine ligase
VNIGLTYDLLDDYRCEGFRDEELAEFDSNETITAIEEALHDTGFETERIGNIKQLVHMLSAGKRWDLVFNITEGMHGMGREALVPALLDAYKIPYTFSDPVVMALTLHKGMAKRIMKDFGIPTPAFSVVENTSELNTISLPFPLFVKPVAEGTGKGISAASKVSTRAELIAVGTEVLNKFEQPVLIEKYLPGREFTVGIIGTGPRAEALPAMEILFRSNAGSETYSYKNKKNYRETVYYKQAGEEYSNLALRTWRCFGCRDAGRVDLRLDEEGAPHILEINPLAGLNPRDSDLPILCSMSGIKFRELIELIMDSAMERIPDRQSAGQKS